MPKCDSGTRMGACMQGAKLVELWEGMQAEMTQVGAGSRGERAHRLILYAKAERYKRRLLTAKTTRQAHSCHFFSPASTLTFKRFSGGGKGHDHLSL